jgi:hypothetical protein
MGKKELNRKQIFSLIILVIFVLSTIGFAMMQFGEPEQEIKPFKACRNNSDCILICGNAPVFINCTNNICEQTECP